MNENASLFYLSQRQSSYVACFKMLHHIIKRYVDKNIDAENLIWCAIITEFCDTWIDSTCPHELENLKTVISSKGLKKALLNFLTYQTIYDLKDSKNVFTSKVFMDKIELLFQENHEKLIQNFFLQIVQSQIDKQFASNFSEMKMVIQNEGKAAVNSFIYLITQIYELKISSERLAKLKQYLSKVEHLLSLSDDFIDLKKDKKLGNINITNLFKYRIYLGGSILKIASKLLISQPFYFPLDFLKFNVIFWSKSKIFQHSNNINETRHTFETRQVQLGPSPSI